MPKMRASFQGRVRVLAKSLYPEPDVFIRELLQNTHDSIQLRRIDTAGWTGLVRSRGAGPATGRFSEPALRRSPAASVLSF